MTVTLDISSLAYDRGVSRYTLNLARALSSLLKDDLYLWSASLRQRSNITAKLEKTELTYHPHQQIPLPPSLLSELWRRNLPPKPSSTDVFHSWDWIQPPAGNYKLISTIHDLAILKYPETASTKVLAAHQKSWQVLSQQQAHIIAVSHSTAYDIRTLLEVPQELIEVVPEALPQEVILTDQAVTPDQEAVIAHQLHLDKPFALFVGTREPRKNLLKLIEAWQPFASELDLVVAGEVGWDNSTRFSQPELRFLGKVTDQELVTLYRRAELLTYPSLDEGFGLPILEAFHFGLPVVTSDRSAMPEVAGTAAALVNPDDPSSISRGIKIIVNESTKHKKERRERMAKQLATFSWHKTASATVKVYQRAIIA